MVNFGPLTAEIGSTIWGTPANFNWFRVLAALLHGSQVVGVSQTAAGRPSRWALGPHSIAQNVEGYAIVVYYERLDKSTASAPSLSLKPRITTDVEQVFILSF